MAKPLSKETIQGIRNRVLGGKSKFRVAKELGVGKTTVYRHTIDIPSNRRLDKKVITKIRKEVLKGKSKYRVTKEIGLIL